MVRLLFFHLGFYFSGGGERLVLEEIQGLRQSGYEVDCFSPIVDTDKCFPDTIAKYAIHPLLPQLPKWFPKRHTITLLTTCILFPFLALRFRNYDVVVAANQPSLYFGLVLKRLFGIPYVSYLAQPLRLIHPRAIDLSSGLYMREKLRLLPYLAKTFRGLFNAIDVASVKASDVVLANGLNAKSIIDKTYQVDSISCPAPSFARSNKSKLAMRNRQEGSVRLGSSLIRKPYLLITNRHFPQKRFEYGIVALSYLVSKHNIRLVITGEPMGEYSESLQLLAKQLQVSDRVDFVGYLTDKDISRAYANALVYLYTAPEEDFGMGVVEAMSFGVPIVAWDSGGPKSILEPYHCGLLAKPFEVGDFSSKISRFIADPKLYKSTAAKALVEAKKYSIENHTAILVNSISDCLHMRQ